MGKTRLAEWAFRVAATVMLCAALFWMASCASNQHESDQQIQRQAQEATERAKIAAQKAAAQARVAAAEAERDANDVAKGVRAGLHDGKGPVNVNSASREDLEKLPGVTPAVARRIAANRPYVSPHDLVRKGVVSQSEYERISGDVTAH